MQHKNTVFHGLVANIPWQRFDRLVAQHQADKGVRRLPTKSQFLALLYGQFAGATSLRDLVGGFASHGGRLYHLGARVVKRSSLAEANARRPSAVFSGLFAALLERVQPRLAVVALRAPAPEVIRFSVALLREQAARNAAAPAPMQVPGMAEENRKLEAAASEIDSKGRLEKSRRKSMQFENYSDKHQKVR